MKFLIDCHPINGVITDKAGNQWVWNSSNMVSVGG